MLNVIIINLLITVSYLNSQTNYNDIDDDDDNNNGNTNITRLARWHYCSASDQRSEGCGFEAY